MRLGSRTKKIFAILSLFSFLGSFALPFSFVYAQTQAGSASSIVTAIMGCSGVGTQISTKLSEVFDGEISKDGKEVPTKDGKTSELNKKEKCWDAIGYAAAKTALAALTQTTINYINSGFKGNPYWARNEGSLLRSIGDQEIYSFVSELNNTEKYPFGPEIAQSLATFYGCDDMLDNGACFRDMAVFTLADDIGSNWEDFATDFSVGGWQGWLSLTQNPYNNPIGFNFEASREINRRTDQKQQSLENELLQNGGFLSVKKCVAYFRMEKITSITKDGASVTSYKKVLDENGKPIIDTVQSEDTSSGKEILYYDTNGNPVYDNGDISSSFDYQYSYLGQIDNCARYETTTPGSVISDQINLHLGSSVRQLELADEMNESLAAVFDALINKLVYDGLDSLETASLGTTQSGGYGSNNSYYNTNGTDSWYIDPLAPVDLYLRLRCMQSGGIIPGADIGDHGDFWGGLYDGTPPTPGIVGGTGAIGYEDIAGGIDGEVAGIEGGVTGTATGYADPGADDPTYAGPVTVFGITGGISGPLSGLSDPNPPCKTDIALTEEYISVLTQARDSIAEGLLPVLRKIDKTLPEPDIGWQDRVYNEYIKQRDYLMQTTSAEDFIGLLYSLPLSGIVAGISHALGYCPECDIEQERETAISSLDAIYPREIQRINYDIEHFNLPSAPVARAERDKITTYEAVLDSYSAAISAQQSNLARLNYINSQLPLYGLKDSAENATLMERLQATYAYASPTMATQSAIDTAKVEITNTSIDLESAKNILPIIESEVSSCSYPFACHTAIQSNEISKIGSHRSVLTSSLAVGGVVDAFVDPFDENSTMYGLINYCYPDGLTLNGTANAEYSATFWVGGTTFTSLCSLSYLQNRGIGTTDTETKDLIYLVHQYKNKQLLPIDDSANPYSVYYPFPNPPYNPWGIYQVLDPIAGDTPISIDGYDFSGGSNIYSNYLSLEARLYFMWVGSNSGDSVRRIKINPFIKAYPNSEYGG